MKKQVYFLSIISALSLIALIIFGAIIPPSIESAIPIFSLLLLLYVCSVSVVSLIFVLSSGRDWSRHLTLIFLIGCVPPSAVMIASLRQASVVDFIILLITVVLIVWYATYNKK